MRDRQCYAPLKTISPKIACRSLSREACWTNCGLTLVNAAGRGVRVVLLLQGRVEYFIKLYATRALYGNFLDTGIEFYEAKKRSCSII